MKRKIYSKDIILILAASFFYFASPMTVTPLIVGFSESLGAGAFLMGIIGGLMNLCSLFCRPFVGNLADKISKYKLSFIGGGLMVLACLGYVFAFNPMIVAVSRIVNGVGFACCSVCMSTWMSNMLPKEKIGSGMGIYGMMNALAMAMAPALGIFLYRSFGYRVAFISALVISLMMVFVVQFVHDKGNPSESIEKNIGAKQKWSIVDKNVLPVAFIIMLFAIPYCATQSFLVSYVSMKNLSVSVGMFFPLYALVLLILRFMMKGLFDKLPFKTFILTSSLSSFMGLFFLSVMNNDFFMFLAALFMAGGYGIMSSVCQSTAILLAGKNKRGLANSTYYIGLDLGMTLGPVIGGVLYGNFGISLFYPMLMFTIPLAVIVYYVGEKSGILK